MARWLTRVTATLGGLFILGFAGFAVWAAIAGDTGWLGDVPTWIASAMVVFAAAQFARDRDDRISSHAVKLSCWLEVDTTTPKRVYGFVLDNRSDAPFHEVEVEVEIHGRPQPVSRVFVVPPGRFFVEQRDDTRFRWEFATPYPADRDLRPVMNSSGYAVKSVTFRDTRGQLWRSVDGGQPRRVRGTKQHQPIPTP